MRFDPAPGRSAHGRFDGGTRGAANARLRRIASSALSLLGLVSAALVPSPAQAAPALRLTQLATLCAADRGAACRAYILGVADGARVLNAAENWEPLFCVPEKVSDTELVGTVADLAREDVRQEPDNNLLAASFISAALLSRYSCK